MSVTNPFTIVYGSRSVGGSSGTYQLLGAYVIDRSYRAFRLVFDVLVVSTSADGLKSASETLELAFRKRDEDLTITMGSSVFTFTAGTSYFNPIASISKSGDSDTDRGVSRAYTCVVEAELPSDDDGTGLLEVRYNVDFEPSRQQVVTIEGAYTATSGATALANYNSNGDTLATTFLGTLTGSPVMELSDETFDQDRNNTVCNFTRQYTQLLADQSKSGRDDTSIVDHRMIFTEQAQHPGDTREGIFRLRRVVGAYDCALDIDVTTNLQSTFKSKVRPHVLSLFKSNFTPSVFAVEDFRVSYDETTKRMSVSIQFLYQKAGGTDVVEVSQSVAYREQRTIDYTPTHGEEETSMYADVGWATIERIWTRTAIVLGDQLPQRRIGIAAKYGAVGDFDDMGDLRIEGKKDVQGDGWNILSNTSQVTDQWLGDPGDGFTQIKAAVLTETVVERFHTKPTSGGTRAR